MTDTTAETAEDAAALRTELARFHEGEEPYEDEAVVPAPGQWIWKWNRATPERRLDQVRHIQATRDRLDRIEALARHWEDAEPLLPGQALADLCNALSDNPRSTYAQAVYAGEHLIRVTGARVPMPAEREAIGALLDANADAHETATGPSPERIAEMNAGLLDAPARFPADQARHVVAALQGLYVPPPPGSDRDVLPDHLLALITVPAYLSTGCEVAGALTAAAEHNPSLAGELREWAARKHASCRRTNKSTGQLCICPHHQEDQ